MHSSVSPQQSHKTNSTSSWEMSFVAAAVCVSGVERTIGSLIIVADIANKPVEQYQTINIYTFSLLSDAKQFFFFLQFCSAIRLAYEKTEEGKKVKIILALFVWFHKTNNSTIHVKTACFLREMFFLLQISFTNEA